MKRDDDQDEDHTERRQITGSAKLFEAVDEAVWMQQHPRGFAGYVSDALRMKLEADGHEVPPSFDGARPGRKPGQAAKPAKTKRGAKSRT